MKAQGSWYQEKKTMTAELKTRQRGDFNCGKEKHEIIQPDMTLEHVATAHEWFLKVFKLL